MKKTVLVTGGSGYVGAVLVPFLLGKGYAVRVVDLLVYGDVLEAHKNLDLIHGDIRDRAIITEALNGVGAVIHLAAVSNDPSFELDPALGKSINYDATLQLIDTAKEAGVGRFIYASSSSVYGVKHERHVTEDLPPAPLTDYSKYKALCEVYLLGNRTDSFIPIVIRPATACGYSPRMRFDLTVNLLTISALVKRTMTVFGGRQKRPNIHITDMCRAYVTILEAPEKRIAGQIFNAGYQNYTVHDLARMVRRVLRDPTITIDVKPTSDTRSYHISSEKFKRELGFEAKHSVEEAVLDIKKAYELGLFPDAQTDKKYHNIEMMKAVHL